jgi:hypothetical protein
MRYSVEEKTKRFEEWKASEKSTLVYRRRELFHHHFFLIHNFIRVYIPLVYEAYHAVHRYPAYRPPALF